jgi:dipeptidyl-peptidase 4
VVELLRRQGVTIERSSGRAAGLERFLVDGLRHEPPFEGHRPTIVEGRWLPSTGRIDSGWYRVPTAQPLGVLAAYLLEPASEDGIVTWNLLDAELAPGRAYPILRSRTAVAATAAQPGENNR